MKKFMLFLAAFLMLISPLAAAQAMSVTWEWLLDDPEVNYYRYQLDAQEDDGWTTVDGTVSSYTVDGLDPYSTYTLYLQRSYDGIYWSPSAEAVAEPLLVEEIPESTDITPVIEPVVDEIPVVEAPVDEVEEVVEEETAAVEEEVEPAEISLVVEEPEVEAVPELSAPSVSIVPDVAPSYVAEKPEEEPVVAIGEEYVVDEDYIVVGEDTAEKVIEVEDIVLVDDDYDEEVEEVVEEIPSIEETPVVEETVVEEVVPVEEEAPAVEEVIETPVVEAVPEVEEVAAKNDFRFSLLLKGGANIPLDFKNKIQIMPFGATATLGFDFANIVKLGSSAGLGIRTDVGLSLIPNATGWGARFKSIGAFFDMGAYAYTVDPAIYVTLDAMAGIVDFTFGAGFSGGILFPEAIMGRGIQYGYNNRDTVKDYGYKMAPAALLGMRFYCGNVFSIGLEGTYRATVGDWMHHDVTANLVMGFSF